MLQDCDASPWKQRSIFIFYYQFIKGKKKKFSLSKQCNYILRGTLRSRNSAKMKQKSPRAPGDVVGDVVGATNQPHLLDILVNVVETTQFYCVSLIERFIAQLQISY